MGKSAAELGSAKREGEKAAAEKRHRAFKRLMELKGTDASALARDADVPRTTIYSFLQQKSASFRGVTEVRLAAALGVSVHDLYGDSDAHVEINAVPVVGELADTEVRMFEAPLYEVAAPVLLDMRGYRAYQVGNLYMPPAGRDWLVIVKATGSRPVLGEPCLITLEDGRRFFRKLAKGTMPGVYDLETWTGLPPIRDVKVAEALRFVCLTPPLKPLKGD